MDYWMMERKAKLKFKQYLEVWANKGQKFIFLIMDKRGNISKRQILSLAIHLCHLKYWNALKQLAKVFSDAFVIRKAAVEEEIGNCLDFRLVIFCKFNLQIPHWKKSFF